MAFNAAKQNNSEESYIDKKHFRLFIESILQYFANYYLFKKLDLDYDERIKIEDFINGIM